jgi:hypothetical protein
MASMNAHDMTGIVIFLVAVGILTLGARYAVDSRDGNDWRRGPHRPGMIRRRRRLIDDVTALLRRARAAHERQVELHERFLDRQRPWLARGLRWEGRRVVGTVLPPDPQGGDVAETDREPVR